jgi:hypothetical protein
MRHSETSLISPSTRIVNSFLFAHGPMDPRPTWHHPGSTRRDTPAIPSRDSLSIYHLPPAPSTPGRPMSDGAQILQRTVRQGFSLNPTDLSKSAGQPGMIQGGRPRVKSFPACGQKCPLDPTGNVPKAMNDGRRGEPGSRLRVSEAPPSQVSRNTSWGNEGTGREIRAPLDAAMPRGGRVPVVIEPKTGVRSARGCPERFS